MAAFPQLDGGRLVGIYSALFRMRVASFVAADTAAQRETHGGAPAPGARRREQLAD